MHRIRFIPKTNDPDNPIVRLRCDRIIEALDGRGLDVGQYLSGDEPDILVSASIEFSRWWKLARKRMEKGGKVVFDLSENEFRRVASLPGNKGRRPKRHLASKDLLLRGIQYIRRRRFDSKLKTVVAGSSHVTVSSDDIAHSVSKLNPNVTVIPEPIDSGYPEMPKVHQGRAKTLVWIGMPVNFMYIAEIGDVLRKIMEQENIRLKIITSEALFSFYPNLSRGNPIAIQWVCWRLDSLWRELSDADIGIAPLFWYHWKSPNKVVTYWAAGLPVVAGSSPAYGKWIADGEDGFIAKTRDQWIDYLRLLIHEPKLRNRMGQCGYEKAVRHFSQEAVASRWKSLFEELLADGRG